MLSKNIINVAIGASTLKIIHCTKEDVNVLVQNSILIETKEKLFLNFEDINSKLIKKELQNFLKNNKIKNGIINFSLPDYIIATKVTEIEHIVNKDFLNLVIQDKLIDQVTSDNMGYLTINEQSEVSAKELSVDCHVLNVIKKNEGDSTDGISSIATTYTKTQTLKELKKIARQLKLKTGVLESECSSLLRVINPNILDKNYLIIDIGELFTKVIIAQSTLKLEVRLSPKGACELNNLLSAMYNLSGTQIDTFKKNFGLNTNQKQASDIYKAFIEDSFETFLKDILIELFQDFGELEHYFETIILTGGFFSIPGAKELLQNNVLFKIINPSLIIQDFEPFVTNINFDNFLVKEDILSNINSYASCVGLTIRGGV